MVYTNKQKFNKKYGQKLNEPNSKKEISKLTGISMKILDEVYYRGVGAFKTNPKSVRPNMTKESWGHSRVYSFAVGGKTQKTTDKDLWDKHLKKLKKKLSKV
tara:strand:- start:1215 stop:1520 length:306 start_codon:yes stop_codon:yes gene_type:complete